jgi:hypothetical protein
MVLMVKRKPSNEKPFERFQRFMRGIVAVPKKEIEAEQARWRESRAAKKKSAKT